MEALCGGCAGSRFARAHSVVSVILCVRLPCIQLVFLRSLGFSYVFHVFCSHPLTLTLFLHALHANCVFNIFPRLSMVFLCFLLFLLHPCYAFGEPYRICCRFSIPYYVFCMVFVCFRVPLRMLFFVICMAFAFPLFAFACCPMIFACPPTFIPCFSHALTCFLHTFLCYLHAF